MPDATYTQEEKLKLKREIEALQYKAKRLEEKIAAIEQNLALAGTKNGGEPNQKKSEQDALDRVRREVAGTPQAQEISRLRQELDQLKSWKSQLQGRGGIVVTDTIIELRQNANGLKGGGAGGGLGPLVFTFCLDGVATDYNVNAEIV